MDLEFSTTQIDPQPILGIRAQAKMQDLPNLMGAPLRGGLWICKRERTAALRHALLPIPLHGQRVRGHGMRIARHLRPDGTDRIQAGELPGGTVATVIHKGPYEGLPQTWAALVEWISAQGLQPAGAPWEVYLTDPGAEPDSSKWRTQIFFPVQ